MPPKSQYEIEREANIARNRALFEDLGLKDAMKDLGVSAGSKKVAAKPVQPRGQKREKPDAENQPRRQSRRLLGKLHPNPDETPEQRAEREREEEHLREAQRLEAEEKARIAKRPRHDTLNFITLAEENNPQELSKLTELMASVPQSSSPRKLGDPGSYDFEDSKRHKAEASDLRDKIQDLKVLSRAKVTTNRIYCAAYHPEKSKDLIFFGDKHGQLGIWDARAPPDEEDDDGDISPENREGGKYWRFQLHWPATPKSSISCIKMDPLDSHNVYTSSYDCTIRSLSFASGSSKEIYHTEDNALICSFDITPVGQEMWISHGDGSATHLDLRENKSKIRRYGLSEVKIGSISINPTANHYLLTASNSRFLKVWDARNLAKLPVQLLGDNSDGDILDFDASIIAHYLESEQAVGMLRGEFKHNKSASSAYWDPRGRAIVSTSYDDTLRIWDLERASLNGAEKFNNFKPFCHINHNCQTGKWLTILRAQWSPNPDAYPHFTVANMNHGLDIYSAKGEHITRLADPSRISAVQAVTCSHPSIVERAASGNASGRCVLWGPEESG